jgi:formylglycine-generating enzyme required for sulfatase activity
MKLGLFFIAIALTVLYMFVSVQETEASSSVGLIIDYSETMKETIGSESKIDIAREILGGILDNMKEPLVMVLTMYGHRDENRCDDIELIVVPKGEDRRNVKEKLLKAEPKGKAPIAQALEMTVERLMEIGNSMNIVVLFTDGKMTCEGDLRKTARELRERYDYSIIFHVVGLDLKKEDKNRLRSVTNAGYGEIYKIKNRDVQKKSKNGNSYLQNRVEKFVDSLSENINNPVVHTPKIVSADDMVLIPAGEFIMGTDRSPSHTNEEPTHTVYLDAYYIDKYEVTQRQYKEVMGENPSVWIGSDMPVEVVSWFDAKEYCEKVGKRLPTEAEWEKAAKGGRDDIWAGTTDRENLGEYAWHNINARQKAHPVGQKKPNGYGIYDMSGNLYEWVSDWYKGQYYNISPKKNPTGPEEGLQRVLRGGSWDNHWYGIRTTRRIAQEPSMKTTYYGFRCAKSAE